MIGTCGRCGNKFGFNWSQVPSPTLTPTEDPYFFQAFLLAAGVIDAPVAALDAARVSGPFGAVAGGQEADRFALSFQLGMFKTSGYGSIPINTIFRG